VLLTLSALESKTGRGVRVAVIDSGVHAAHPHVQGVWGGIGIDDEGREHDDYIDRLGHGTAVAAAIREKAPDAELYAVKVFDRDLRSTGRALVAGLRCARQSSARIANLSLGTRNPEHETELAREVAEARAAGMLVVAAGAQDDARWLPGALPGVVAVTMDMRVPRDACEIAVVDDAIVVTACGYPRPIPGVPPERNLQGISFAVANATGMLARLLEGTAPGVTIADLLRKAQR
jgi:subtilisin family serine protease